MLRRDIKLFSKCIISGIAIFLVLAVLFGVIAAVASDAAEKAYTPVKVAVVDCDDSLYSRITVNVIKNLGYISELLEMKRIVTDDPESLFGEGYSAVIVLPKGYLDDIVSAENTGGTVLVSSRLGAQREIVASVARFGEAMLAAGQNGTFCGLFLIRDHGLSSEVRRAYLDEVNLTLVNEAFSAHGKYVTEEVLDYEGTGLDSDAYYVSVWLSFLMMMSAICFIPLYTRDLNQPMLRRLRSCGLTRLGFWSWKLILSLIFRILFVTAAIFAAAHFGVAVINFEAVCLVILFSAYVTLSSCVLTVASRDGITVNLLLSAGGLIACGGIVPRRLLPDILLRIGDLSPFGVAKSLLSTALGAPVSASASLLAFVYAAASVIILYLKTERTMLGKLS